MKRYLIIGMMLVILLTIGFSYCEKYSVDEWEKQNYFLSGSVLDKNGNYTEFTRAISLGYVSGVFKGRRIKLRFSDITKIENLENDYLRITNKAGDTFSIELSTIAGVYEKRYVEGWSIMLFPGFAFYYIDPISMKEVI